MSDIWRIAGAIILPNSASYANERISHENVENWYKKLKLPSYAPPLWAYPPVCTALYSAMGYASYLVLRDGDGFSGDAKWPLVAYGAQLALNWAYTPIFVGQRNVKAGLITAAALTAAASATGVLFYRVNKTAGLIFIPYVAWLSFCTAVNYAIYKMNPSKQEAIATPEEKED